MISNEQATTRLQSLGMAYASVWCECNQRMKGEYMKVKILRRAVLLGRPLVFTIGFSTKTYGARNKRGSG